MSEVKNDKQKKKNTALKVAAGVAGAAAVGAIAYGIYKKNKKKKSATAKPIKKA